MICLQCSDISKFTLEVVDLSSKGSCANCWNPLYICDQTTVARITLALEVHMTTSGKTLEDWLKPWRKGGQHRVETLRTIVQEGVLKDLCTEMLKTNTESLWRVQELFTEALIILDRQVRTGTHFESTKLKDHFMAICGDLLKDGSTNQRRDGRKETESVMNDIGHRCRQVLKMSRLGYSPKDISIEAGLSSEGMVHKTRFKCLMTLMESIKDRQDV